SSACACVARSGRTAKARMRRRLRFRLDVNNTAVLLRRKGGVDLDEDAGLIGVPVALIDLENVGGEPFGGALASFVHHLALHEADDLPGSLCPACFQRQGERRQFAVLVILLEALPLAGG